MEDTYYVHDAGYAKLIVFKLPRFDDIEAAVQKEAEAEGLHWNDCSWGGVRHISMKI